jgi:hypothetical protein
MLAVHGALHTQTFWICRDLSLWSFEKLADTKYGVIAIEWRDVPCNYRPVKRAKNPFSKRSTGERSAPRGWRANWDRRPFNVWTDPASGRKLRGIAGAV